MKDIKEMTSSVQSTFLKVNENAKKMLELEKKHLATLEKMLDEKRSLLDKLIEGKQRFASDVTEGYDEKIDSLRKIVQTLNNEYAMSQEIIEHLKHNFDLE